MSGERSFLRCVVNFVIGLVGVIVDVYCYDVISRKWLR